MNGKPWHWVVPETDNGILASLAETLGLHRLTAACLVQRGVSTVEEARFFLHGGLDSLGDPFTMAGMEKAVDRLAQAVKRRENIFIYGDYDADGVTSVALMCSALQKLNVPVEYYIPSRLGDGYGLHGHVLETLAARGGQLAVTVDCGINSFAEMELAGRLGIDLIVTDHHECFPGERHAYAVLNPKQSHCRYPEKSMAGVGVAWTLIRALHRYLGIPFSETAEFLDLVAVGSIADVVPLLGENRILVREGLRKLETRPLPGLSALAKISGVADTRLSAIQVAFTLAPRLNAPGRLGDASTAVEALLAGPDQAENLAAELDTKNGQRQQVEKDILGQARELAAGRNEDPALVLWHQDWHPGVVGIVAGRLASEFARPVALIAQDGDVGHGSVRSVPGCNLVEALQCCAERLERFGGHPEAAGLTVKTEWLEGFRADFCAAVAKQGPKEYQVAVAAEAQPADLSLELVNQLAMLEPYGQGNPEPHFYLAQTTVVSARNVGNSGAHLQLKLQKKSPVMPGICFGGGGTELPRNALVDLVVIPTANTWQGKTNVSLQVRDIRLSSVSASLTITDLRGKDKDTYLGQWLENKKVLAWVNTKAAGDYLQSRFGNRLLVTQLGRQIPHSPCDTLFFYHLPFDPAAVKGLYKKMCFNGVPEICLAYGTTDLLLNERIYAATMPGEQTMAQLAACMEQGEGTLTVDDVREVLTLPVTAHLLARAQAVFEEAAGKNCSDWSAALFNLDGSPTYRESNQMLASFRACQSFWWEAQTADIACYLEKQDSVILPKGERHNDSARAKRPN
jgi:single-stranded-DNA-specific exonuclease